MKLIIIVEGKDEKTFYNALLKRNLFCFDRKDLLLREIIHCRQLVNHPHLIQEIARQKGQVEIYRFGDKLTDLCDKGLPQVIKNKIFSIIDYNVVPEFEILLILNEGMLDDFQKHDNKKLGAARYAKSYIKHNKMRYDKSSEWIMNYVYA